MTKQPFLKLNLQHFAEGKGIYDQYIVGKAQSVVDELLLLNMHQIPLITALGFAEPITQTRHEWFEDEMFKYESEATAAALVDATEITVAEIEPFRPEQVVRNGDELMLVTSVSESTNKITVVRGHASTTAEPVAEGSTIEVLFVEGREGRDAREARYKGRKPNHNITQIFDDTISISGTAEQVTQYGVANPYELEKQKKMVELALQLEKAAINGIEYQDGTKRLMRGIRDYIQTNVNDAGGTALTIDMINDLGQELYHVGAFKQGGRFGIMVGPKQKRIISKFENEKIRVVQSENERGLVVDRIVTDFGEFDIMLNSNLRSDELFLTDLNRIKIRPVANRDFFHKFMGDTGDKTTGILVGEYTLELRQEKAHGRIKGLQ